MDGASDQKKSSCGQEGGKERQGQAERQRRYQFELGQFQDMLAGTSPGGCNAAKFAAPLVVAVVQDPSHLGLLCCSLLSRPSLHLQSGRQHNLLPLPMPFVSVLSVRTACPAASAFSDDAISSLGLAAAFKASRPSGASVSSGDDAIKLADTAKNGKHGDRARARSSWQVRADRWTFLFIVSVSFLWLSFGSLLSRWQRWMPFSKRVASSSFSPGWWRTCHTFIAAAVFTWAAPRSRSRATHPPTACDHTSS